MIKNFKSLIDVLFFISLNIKVQSPMGHWLVGKNIAESATLDVFLQFVIRPNLGRLFLAFLLCYGFERETV